MTYAKPGTNIKMICAANAIGVFIPSILIFPRTNFEGFLPKGAPVSTIGAANTSRWSNNDQFHDFSCMF